MPPTHAKGRRYPVEISAVAWLDLLGYGGMLAEARFDPADAHAVSAVERLRVFQRTAVASATRLFPAMPINDGVIYFADLSPRTNSVTFDFLRRCVEAHESVNEADREREYPGARMVVAVGPRLRMGRSLHSDANAESIFARLRDRRISLKQAVHEAIASAPVAGFVPALQANFAFTRAYLADQAGKEGGLEGPRCYVQLDYFSDPLPSWITFRRIQRWEAERLNLAADFGELVRLDRRVAARLGYEGLRNALEIELSMGIGLSGESTLSRSEGKE